MSASTETLHAAPALGWLRIPQLADWTMEAWAYVLLGCYATATRLFELGAAPLAGSAARDAMWAWEQARGLPVPATAVPNSALLFSLQMLLFFLLFLCWTQKWVVSTLLNKSNFLFLN